MTPENQSVCTYIEQGLTPQQRKACLFEVTTLSQLAPDWDHPFIALVDGQPVLRKDWDIPMYTGHMVVFVDARAIPQGGGGSDPLRMIATLAVLAFSVALPGMGFMATPILDMATAFGVGGNLVMGAISGLAFFGGMSLVNAMLPPESASISGSQALESPSPTYSLQAQGNYARLEQAIPEHFGRCIAYPDFAAQPYNEAHGNEIYLYQLFVLTRGYCTVESIRIEDTAIENFENVEYEILEPGDQVTLFPTAVEVSREVSSQDLTTGEYVGPYTAVSEGKNATHLGFDLTATRGLYHAKNTGKLEEVSVEIQFEARKIDDNGDPMGEWFVLDTITYSAATITPQRYSEKFAVAGGGRFEGRIKRLDEEQTETTYGHHFVWSGLKSYMAEPTDYGDITLLAIKMQASSQLSSQASRKINCILVRKLPVWDGSTWSLPQETRSIAWAAAYCCRACGIPENRIDLAKLLYLDGIWSAQGDECNGRVDSFLNFWPALTKICRPGRCKPFPQGGVVRFFYDAPQTMPVALFSMRNIVRGSFKVNYLQPTTDTADAVEASYFDEDVWHQRRVLCKLADSTDENPTKVEYSFVTNRDRAHVNGLYDAGCNQRRRKLITLETEMGGFIPSGGDLILVQHDMPAWGQGGEVVYFGSGAVTATFETSEPLEWTDGATHYVAFTRLDGSTVGPFVATQIAENDYAFLVDVAELAGFEPYLGASGERSRYSFGPGDAWAQRALVLTAKPKGMRRVEILATNDDPGVFTGMEGVTTPPPKTSLLDNYTSRPIVSGVAATVSPTDQAKILLSWSPAPWADHYLVEISSNSANWTRVAEPQTTSCTVDALYGTDTMIRVAAVGVNVGPWVEIAYTTVQQIEWDASLSGFAVTLNKANAVLSWDTSANWNVSGYECRVGGDWDTGTPLFTKKTGDSYSYQPGAGGYTYHFKAINKFGEYSADTATASLTITAPSLQSLTRKVANYSVTLSWEEIAGTFPVEFAEIRKGAVFATAEVIGKTTGDYLQLTETAAGTYTYWVRLKDTSGNYSAAFDVSATVAPAEDIVSDLQGMLTFQTLDAALGAKIDLIDNDAAGSVNARILTEANDRAQAILNEAAARSGADSSLQSQIDVLSAASTGDLQDLISAVENEATARADADSAEATARQTLATQLRGSYTGTSVSNVTSGLLYSERTARSSADTALSSDISSLSATVTNNYNTLNAAITNEQTARSDGDSALSSSISSLSSTVSGNYNTLNAAITNEQTARSDGDSANASSISTLQTTVTNNYGTLNAAIQSEASVRASQTGALFAQYTIKLDVNGYTTGIGLASTGPTGTGSVIKMRGDKFTIGPSSGTSGNITPFVYDAVSGKMSVDGIFAKTASIGTLKVAGRAITVPTITNATSSASIGPIEQTVLSHTVDTLGGEPLKIEANINVNSVYSRLFLVIYKDSSQLGSIVVTTPGTSTFIFQDNPSSGEHTYSIKAMTNDGYSTINYRTIATFEALR